MAVCGNGLAKGLARKCGVSRRTVRRWARGDFAPSPKRQHAINEYVAGVEKALMLPRGQYARIILGSRAMTDRVLDRYYRDCRRNGRAYQAPSDVDEGPPGTWTLSNCNGVLARYRLKGERLFQVEVT